MIYVALRKAPKIKPVLYVNIHTKQCVMFSFFVIQIGLFLKRV
jgi:hypothetical protein